MSRTNRIQVGDYLAEARVFTELAEGTEILITPELTNDQITKARSFGINATWDNRLNDNDEPETRMFITGGYAEQAGYELGRDRSLSPHSIKRLLETVILEDKEEDGK